MICNVVSHWLIICISLNHDFLKYRQSNYERELGQKLLLVTETYTAWLSFLNACILAVNVNHVNYLKTLVWYQKQVYRAGVSNYMTEFTLGCTDYLCKPYIPMMTSSNGNIFRVTGPLCGEFTGHRWIPLTNVSDAELWCFLWSAPGING